MHQAPRNQCRTPYRLAFMPGDDVDTRSRNPGASPEPRCMPVLAIGRGHTRNDFVRDTHPPVRSSSSSPPRPKRKWIAAFQAYYPVALFASSARTWLIFSWDMVWWPARFPTLINFAEAGILVTGFPVLPGCHKQPHLPVPEPGHLSL